MQQLATPPHEPQDREQWQQHRGLSDRKPTANEPLVQEKGRPPHHGGKGPRRLQQEYQSPQEGSQAQRGKETEPSGGK